MEDTIRCDLSGYDRDYVIDVLDEFLDGAHRHGRFLAEIRMSPSMSEKLELEDGLEGKAYRDVPVTINADEYEGTIEVRFERLGWSKRLRNTLGLRRLN